MISKNNLEFLINLQHKLNTQETDGNANPVFWGIMEEKEIPAHLGYGEKLYIDYNYKTYKDHQLEQLIEDVTKNENLDSDFFDDIERNNLIEVFWILEKEGFDIRMYEYDISHNISKNTGAFLTKSACQEYINQFGYNHKNPYTYAMTAFRNFELEQLLEILKTADFEELLENADNYLIVN